MRKQTFGQGSITEKQVLKLLYEHGPMTRNQLASSLGLSMPTLSHVITDLMSAGFVGQAQTLRSTGGRRAMTLELVSGCRLALSVEIGDTGLELALTDLTLRTIAIDRFGLPADQAARHQQAMDGVIGFLNREQVPADRLLGITILTPETQPELEAQRLAQTLTEELECPAAMLTRELAASLANALPLENGIYLELGSRVHCLEVRDHRPILPQGRDLAHVVADLRSEQVCPCGRRGCFARLGSTKQLWASACDRESALQLLKWDTGSAVWQAYLRTLAGFLDNLQTLMDLPITIASDFTMELSCDLPNVFEALTGRTSEQITLVRAMNDDPITGSALWLIHHAIYR